MAAKAAGGGIVEFEGRKVTLGACQAGVRADQLEDSAVIETGRFPAGGGVAVRAGAAFAAAVFVIRLMAADTGLRGALEFGVDVTLCALRRSVCARQREGRGGVAEGGGLPGVGRVTGGARRAEPALVGVILEMAGDAAAGGALEHIRRGVAFGAQHTGVRAA